MLVGRAFAGSNQLKSMHLGLLAFKISWRPRKECCMALKHVCRFVNTVSKEGPDVCKSNKIVFVTYTWLADVNASVAKCLCF